MPDPAGTYNGDGALKFGSQVLTIKDASGADQDYIAESFSLKAGASWMVSKDANGVPRAQAAQIDVPTGTATLQFAAANTKKPKIFAEFTAIEAGGGIVTVIVADVGQDFGHDKEAKFSIGLRLKINQ